MEQHFMGIINFIVILNEILAQRFKNNFLFFFSCKKKNVCPRTKKHLKAFAWKTIVQLL